MRWSFGTIDGLEGPAASTWASLHAGAYHEHPLLHLDFVRPLLAAFPSPEAKLARLEDGGQTLGFAILEPRTRFLWDLYRPPQQPLGMLLLHPRAWQDGDPVRRLLRSLPGWALLLSVSNQDPEYGFDPRALTDPAAEVLPHATTISVTISGTHDAYWKARSKKLRENVSRYFRRIEKDGAIATFRVSEGPREIEAAFREYCELECAGWKGKEGTALQADSGQGLFFGEVMRRFAARGEARAYAMYLGDRLVASRLAIRGGGIVVFLKTTYDEEASSYAPGRLLLYSVIREFFARRDARRLEFYTNATADQLQWTDESRQIWHVNYYRSAVLRALSGLRRRVRSAGDPRSRAASKVPAENAAAGTESVGPEPERESARSR